MSITKSINIQQESQEHFNLNEQTDFITIPNGMGSTGKGNFIHIISYIKDYKKIIENVLVTYQRQLKDKTLKQSSTEGGAQPTMNQNLEKIRFIQRRSEILI